MKIAIIGAGFGGLSAALLLSGKGHNVEVFEQLAVAGGKAGELKMGNYRFDTGPSLLTMPFVFEELFNDVGKRLQDYVSYKQLDVLCAYWFSDGLRLCSYSDKKKHIAELSAKTSTTKKELRDFYTYTKSIYNVASPSFLYAPFLSRESLSLKNLKILFSLHKLDVFTTMHDSIQKRILDPHVQQLFMRYATYVGSNPYVCPATLNIVSQIEYKYGGYYPTTGIYSIVKGLVKACKEQGVRFHFNSPVQKLLIKQRTVTGLRVKNKDLSFDRVVSDVDVRYLYTTLIDKDTSMRKKYSRLEPSSSALVFYWAVKGTHSQLDVHNIFFTHDYKKEFSDLFEEKTCSKDPTIYINITSKCNPRDAPRNGENWFVMINAPSDDGQDWNAIIDEQRAIIKKKLQTVLGPINIIKEKTLTPVDIEKNTHSLHGAIYGTSSNDKMAAFLRHKNKSRLKNLYCCGGSTHPGGGMTLSALSGRFVAEMIR